MATQVYKIGTSYYRADNNQKILNPTELQALKPVLVNPPTNIPQQQTAPPVGMERIPNPASIPNYTNVTSPQPGNPAIYGIKRDGAGFIQEKQNTLGGNLGNFSSGVNLVDIVGKVMKEKMNANVDLRTQQQVWRQKQLESSNQFSGADTIFTGMSPADQAKIRTSDYAISQSNLEALDKESDFRATATKDTLQTVSDLYKEQIQALQNEKSDANEKARIKIAERQNNLQEQRNKILSAKDLADAGLPYQFDPVTGDIKYDWSGVTTQQIADSIKRVESGGDYNAKGKSGEFGAYQFMPRTWNAWSNEYLKSQGKQPMSLLPTPANQDAVATWKIEQLQKQGYTPDQIASIWNSGSPEYAGKVGTNSQGVKYNVPGYVKKVTSNLMSGSPARKIVKLTQANKTDIATSLGLTSDYTKDLTEDEWILLANQDITTDAGSKDSARTGAINTALNTARFGAINNVPGQSTLDQITLDQGGILSPQEIQAAMSKGGYTWDENSKTWTIKKK